VFPKIEELHRDLIDEFLRGDPGGFGVVFDLLAMLIKPSEEIGIKTP
jgi:hypothetical protein